MKLQNSFQKSGGNSQISVIKKCENMKEHIEDHTLVSNP